MRAGCNVGDFGDAGWDGIAALILAPGVPLTHPEPHAVVKNALAAGVEVIGDVELFCRQRRETAPLTPVVAITGTNGKSTTTALVAHLLRELGHDVQMGGNIGKAVLTLDELSEQRVYVIELSSFQIDLTPSLNPTVGVVLNVTPDHIDRHGTVEHYASVKERLAQRADAPCIGLDDAITRAMADRVAMPDRRITFTNVEARAADADFFAEGTKLYARSWDGDSNPVVEVADIAGVASLRGSHNVQNALAALAALWALRLRFEADGQDLPPVWDKAKLAAALRSFPGLPHRMEEVGRAGTVLFINDSKATNADSTEKALAAFPADIHWILGGKAKDGGITALESYFPRVKKAYLIGAASDEFAGTLDGKVAYERCGTLEAAVKAAAQNAMRAKAGSPVVLLSPACASYDQFRNFEERGDAFRRHVAGLKGVVLRERGA